MHGPTWTFWANLTPFSLQEHLFPTLYNSLRSAIKPLMAITDTGAENQSSSAVFPTALQRKQQRAAALATAGPADLAAEVCRTFLIGKCRKGDACPRRHDAVADGLAPALTRPAPQTGPPEQSRAGLAAANAALAAENAALRVALAAAEAKLAAH
jgi:hypothetical protein